MYEILNENEMERVRNRIKVYIVNCIVYTIYELAYELYIEYECNTSNVRLVWIWNIYFFTLIVLFE